MFYKLKFMSVKDNYGDNCQLHAKFINTDSSIDNKVQALGIKLLAQSHTM